MITKSKITILTLLFVAFSFAQGDVYDIARYGCVEDMQMIVEEYPEAINFKDSRGFLPLTLACYNGNLEVVEVLVKHVKDIDGNSNYGTPLMAAAFKGNYEIVKLLIENGADVDVSDKNDVTALHYVVRFTNRKIMQLLIDNNANIDLKDRKGFSPLDYAMQDGVEDIIKILKKEKL